MADSKDSANVSSHCECHHCHQHQQLSSSKAIIIGHPNNKFSFQHPPPTPSCSQLFLDQARLMPPTSDRPFLPLLSPLSSWCASLQNCSARIILWCDATLRNRHMKPIYYMDLMLLIRTLSHFLQRPLEKFLSHLSAPNSYPPEKLILLSLYMYRGCN